jgi:hypothetical protein
MVGQQSLAPFLGLRIDIKRVHYDNSLKEGIRKMGGCLVNQGDKLTPEQKRKLIAQN